MFVGTRPEVVQVRFAGRLTLLARHFQFSRRSKVRLIRLPFSRNLVAWGAQT